MLTQRNEILEYCLTFADAYADHPFRDPNWCVARHRGTSRVFAWIFDRAGYVWVNVKCDVEWRDFWRQTLPAVVPAYHLNKEHWNSIILNGTVPDDDIRRMIAESYALTKKSAKAK